jgi:hypothetical protein
MTVRTVLVEFLGLPGAGKSTVARRVRKSLEQRGIPVNDSACALLNREDRIGRSLVKLAYVVNGFVNYPRYTVLSANSVLRTEQRSVADLAKTLFNWLFVSSLVRDYGNRAGVCLLDEGIFQALWSIGFSAKKDSTARMLEVLLGLIPFPTAVVAIESSLTVIERRLSTRRNHWSRLEGCLVGGDADALTRAHALLQEAESAVSAVSEYHQHIHVLKVSNDDSQPGPLANTVAEYIAQVLEGNL